MRATTIKIPCTACPGGRATLDAFDDPATPGLAVARMHPPHRLRNAVSDRSWTVTHTTSGASVGDAMYVDRTAAEAAFARMAQIPVNWTAPIRTLVADPTFVRLLINIIAECAAVRSGTDG